MTKTIEKGDRIKVTSSILSTSGKVGTITEVLHPAYAGSVFRARLDGDTETVVLFSSEIEILDQSIGGFKVGDKVGFRYNDSWDDGEAVVISLDPKATYGIEVEMTKVPSKNGIQKVGYTHHWEAKHLKHLPEPVEQVDGFKVGDKVGFEWNDCWADGEGVVTGLRGGDELNIKVKLTKLPSKNDFYPLGSESHWSAKHLKHLPVPVPVKEAPKPKFKTGDSVSIHSSGPYWKGAEGRVTRHDIHAGYLVRITKRGENNLIHGVGDRLWWDERALGLIEKPKPLDSNKLILKPLGAVVEDKDGREWVLVGRQYYVHKSWDGLESLHAAALVTKYGPINERVK